MKQQNIRSQALDLLRFPLAVVILTIHTFNLDGITLNGEVFTFHDSMFFRELNYFIDSFLRGQSVPIYFFISGYVFFINIDRFDKGAYFRKLKNRLHTLLIPYIIWNFLAIIATLLPRMFSAFSHFISYKGGETVITLQSMLACFWMYHGEMSPLSPGDAGYEVMQSSISPINVPLWFLRELMIIVVLTPVLHYLIKKGGKAFICILAVVWFAVEHTGNDLLSLHTNSLFFFAWGAYLSINRIDMIKTFSRYFRTSVAAYIVLGILGMVSLNFFPEAELTIKRLNIVAGLVMAYNIAAWLITAKGIKPDKFLSASSFFIYVSHIIVCQKVSKVLFVCFKPSDGLEMSLMLSASVLITLGLLLAVYAGMKKFTPALLTFMTGRK